MLHVSLLLFFMNKSTGSARNIKYQFEFLTNTVHYNVLMTTKSLYVGCFKYFTLIYFVYKTKAGTVQRKSWNGNQKKVKFCITKIYIEVIP